MRLSKFLAHSGVCSRRGSEKLIKENKVIINNNICNDFSYQVKKNDLVITADIPLAAEVIEKQGKALNPRGELYTSANIRARLNMRDFMDTLRSSGVNTGGPPPLGQSERQAFANNLDKLLTQNKH